MIRVASTYPVLKQKLNDMSFEKCSDMLKPNNTKTQLNMAIIFLF